MTGTQAYVVSCERLTEHGSTIRILVGPYRGRRRSDGIAEVLSDNGWNVEVAPLSDLAAALGYGEHP
jgi:hypothetical protein